MTRASAEKLKHTGPAEKERVASLPQGEQLASTVRQSRFFQKEKEQSRLSRVPDRKRGESQDEGDPHLSERGESEREYEEERVESTVKIGKFSSVYYLVRL